MIGETVCREKEKRKKEITVIGNAVIDVLAKPVPADVFETGSRPVEQIRLAFGGDALNEAVVLSRLGKRADLISKVGEDEAGFRIVSFLKDSGIAVDHMIIEQGLATSINLVLIDEQGERYFLTNPSGSQRKLTEADVDPYLDTLKEIVSFASLFVSPLLDIPAMTSLFRKIKEKGRILAADTTKPKNGEKLEDLAELLPCLDYFFPNEEEIALLTGIRDPAVNAALLVKAGVSCAVIKCGKNGCLIRTETEIYRIPSFPVENCVDTTGAGDSFAAGFLWALSEGLSLMECGAFACAAASCAVERVGAFEGVVSSEIPWSRYRKIKKEAEFEAKSVWQTETEASERGQWE